MGSARCTTCGGLAIVTFSRKRKERVHFCAEHARPLFKEGLQSLPHHDWAVTQDEVRDGERWACRKCGHVVGPKVTSQKAMRERLQLERCEAE